MYFFPQGGILPEVQPAAKPADRPDHRLQGSAVPLAEDHSQSLRQTCPPAGQDD